MLGFVTFRRNVNRRIDLILNETRQQGRSKQFLCFGPELKLAPQIFFFFFFFAKMRPHFIKRRPHRAILRPSYSSFQGGGANEVFLVQLAPLSILHYGPRPRWPPLATALLVKVQFRRIIYSLSFDAFVGP